MKTLRILSTSAAAFFCFGNLFAAGQSSTMYSQNNSRPIVSSAEENSYDESISLFIENDLYFSDRYYTNGLKLLYTGEGDDFLTSKLQFMALRLFVGDRQAYQTACLGQNMYVPGEITQANPPSWDRPYAGWLYVGAGAHLASENRLDSLSVNLGVVGPISLAEQAQKFYHSLIDATWPMGWGYQIKNEPGIEIGYNHSERFVRYGGARGWAADAVGSAGFDLGNVKTQAQIRTLFRFGKNLPYSFDPNRIDAASGNDVEWLSPQGKENWHFFFYGGGGARFVGYDIILDGNTFAHSRSVVPKWLVGEVLAGVSTRYDRYEVDLNYTLRTSEFNNQEYPVHMFWTLRLKVFF